MQSFDIDGQHTAIVPWNKGKILGPKPPLQTKYVWSGANAEGRKRDHSMFNLAIDNKLRGCDSVRLRADDVAPQGLAIEHTNVRQRKTGHPVKFELTDQTREAVDACVKAARKRTGDFLFPSCRYPDRSMRIRQYARLVSDWMASIGLDPSVFGTHSLRRTKATLIYNRTGIYELSNCYLGSPRSRARFATLGSRLTMRSRLLSRLRSEIGGQSGHALPVR